MRAGTSVKSKSTSFLIKICKNGQFTQGLEVVNEWIEQQSMSLSHLHLSLLIEACIKDGRPEKYKSVWKLMVSDNGVSPNHISYALAVSAAAKCNDITSVHSLINELFASTQCTALMDRKSYNSLMHSITLTSPIDTDLLFEVFSKCKRSTNPNVDPDHFTVCSMLNGCVQQKEFDKFQRFLFCEVLSAESHIRKYVDNVVLIAIINGLVKSGQSEQFEAVWDRIMECNHLVPTLEVYGTALCALSYSPNELLMEQFVHRMYAMKREMTVRHWNQILTAHSNQHRYAAMWTHYQSMRTMQTPDISTFNILISVGDKAFKLRALEEVKQFLRRYGRRNWYRLEYKALRRFHIEAVYCNDDALLSMLKPLMDKRENLQNRIVAEIECEGERMYFDNLSVNEDHSILRLVRALAERVNHTYSNRIVYHAEKKALAFVMDRDEMAMDITISINFRMCIDCHMFFLRVSDRYPMKTIVVNSPGTVHHFNHGQCSCGKH